MSTFFGFNLINFIFVHQPFKKQTNNLFSKTNASFYLNQHFILSLKEKYRNICIFLLFWMKKRLFLTRMNNHFIIGAIINIISILIFFYQGNFSWFPSYWKNSFYKYWVCKCILCDGVTKLLMYKLLFQ